MAKPAVTAPDGPSLYDRIGGAPAVKKLVENFYDRILKDPELAPFFKSSTMQHLRHMQTEYFRVALDGPLSYAGLPLVKAHQGRGIKLKHFNRFAQHVLDALRELKITQPDIDAVITRVNLLAGEITGDSTNTE